MFFVNKKSSNLVIIVIFFVKVIPGAVLKYFSNLITVYLLLKKVKNITFQGRRLYVDLVSPRLCLRSLYLRLEL